MPTSSVPATLRVAPRSPSDRDGSRIYLVGGTPELIEAVAPIVAPDGPDRVIGLAAPELTVQGIFDEINDLAEPSVIVVLPSLRFDSVTERPADLIVERNLKFPFFAIRHFARGMLRSGGGSVVTVAERPAAVEAGAASYAAAAAGLVSLTRVLAVEWAERGLRANSVVMEGAGEAGDQLARAIAFFAGSAASYVTGQCIAVHPPGASGV